MGTKRYRNQRLDSVELSLGFQKCSSQDTEPRRETYAQEGLLTGATTGLGAGVARSVMKRRKGKAFPSSVRAGIASSLLWGAGGGIVGNMIKESNFTVNPATQKNNGLSTNPASKPVSAPRTEKLNAPLSFVGTKNQSQIETKNTGALRNSIIKKQASDQIKSMEGNNLMNNINDVAYLAADSAANVLNKLAYLNEADSVGYTGEKEAGIHTGLRGKVQTARRAVKAHIGRNKKKYMGGAAAALATGGGGYAYSQREKSAGIPPDTLTRLQAAKAHVLRNKKKYMGGAAALSAAGGGYAYSQRKKEAGFYGDEFGYDFDKEAGVKDFVQGGMKKLRTKTQGLRRKLQGRGGEAAAAAELGHFAKNKKRYMAGGALAATGAAGGAYAYGQRNKEAAATSSAFQGFRRAIKSTAKGLVAQNPNATSHIGRNANRYMLGAGGAGALGTGAALGSMGNKEASYYDFDKFAGIPPDTLTRLQAAKAHILRNKKMYAGGAGAAALAAAGSGYAYSQRKKQASVIGSAVEAAKGAVTALSNLPAAAKLGIGAGLATTGLIGMGGMYAYNQAANQVSEPLQGGHTIADVSMNPYERELANKTASLDEVLEVLDIHEEIMKEASEVFYEADENVNAAGALYKEASELDDYTQVCNMQVYAERASEDFDVYSKQASIADEVYTASALECDAIYEALDTFGIEI